VVWPVAANNVNVLSIFHLNRAVVSVVSFSVVSL